MYPSGSPKIQYETKAKTLGHWVSVIPRRAPIATDCDPSKICSNTCEIEWPPKSGKKITIPEIDRADFFNIRDASEKLNPAQVALLTPLEKIYPTEYLNSKNSMKLAQDSLF